MCPRNVLLFGAAAIFLVGLTCPVVQADVATLVSPHSTSQIDTESVNGMNLWTVDGTNYLASQWFWYRVGADGPENSLSGLSLVPGTLIQPSPDNVFFTLENSALRVESQFLLTSDVAGQASMEEKFKFTNKSNSPQTLHFFQYSDFNLSDSDTVEFPTSGNYVAQVGGGVTFSENYVEELTNSFPKHHQAGVGTTLLDLLTNTSPDTLNDYNGPITGDANWAFQWDVTLPANGSYRITITKNLSVVPEPASLMLLGIAGTIGGLLWLRKRDR